MIYPFQTKEYLSLYKKHFVSDLQSVVMIDDVEYEITGDKRALLVGMKPILNNQEITDYGDITLPSRELIQKHQELLKNQYGVVSVEYDYVREDSLLYPILSETTHTPPLQQEVAPMISLPASWDTYLESLERTDRKELKRKWKRIETVPFEVIVYDDSNKEEHFESFITLHKLSDFNKEQFMSDPMKSFFHDLLLLSIPHWSQKLAFLYINKEPVASIFFFENEEELLLYNSGYDPQQKFYSAGLILCSALIKYAIEAKKMKFDFLRGNERYKYDLGGVDCRLFKFII